ncbi:Protein of unknown function [Cognatiyoonia koreensis]|uniref:DUF2848 domain-containing protein n=2 Tax=Cognatiyoonia koreensis TaxID=364200 RepID=A0A1I0RZZ4_9RHOB|nr:DUF2848 domain-containing protein [Cognatiyoonia koreensis]SEW47267.1 Protein of unknown function [Cognatiyoonia koreensis]
MRVDFSLGNTPLPLEIQSVVIAGWTGRNLQAVQHHIDELAMLGIAPPSQVPLYYRVSHTLLCQSESIEVLGTGTSGEVEPLLIQQNGKRYLGLASDHTDRDLERHSVAASKQACAKPVATALWDFDAIMDHLDQITLKCWIEEDGQEVLYQDGTLAGIRPLTDLCEGAGMADGTAMLCGTLAAIGGVRPARQYRMEIHDPTTADTITLSYDVKTLPIIT